MTKSELAEYNRMMRERATVERELVHLLERREEIANRAVRNEARRARFVLRLDRDIEDARGRKTVLDLALEGYGV